MNEQRAVATIPQQALAPLALAVAEVKAQTAALQKLLTQVMVKDTHYGTIPNTPKPTLYKAGAEKIALMLHLSPSFKRETLWEGPHLTIFSECTLTHQATGTVIATAGAMCATRETKYGFRQSTRKCPKCGKPAIIKGKVEYGGGWLCFEKKGGCKAKYQDNDPAITGQSEDREENPNLADPSPTVLKMAHKRAFVPAILFGTAASDVFTQDVEDFKDADLLFGKEDRHQGTAQSRDDAPWTLADVQAEMDAFADFNEFKTWWEANKRGIGTDLSKAEFAMVVDYGKEAKARIEAISRPAVDKKPEPTLEEARKPGRPPKAAKEAPALGADVMEGWKGRFDACMDRAALEDTWTEWLSEGNNNASDWQRGEMKRKCDAVASLIDGQGDLLGKEGM